MPTPRNIAMSLTPDDEAMVRAAEADTFVGVRELLEVYVLGSGTINPITKRLEPAAPTWVAVSGVAVQIMEEDVLLGMGGQVSVGDWKACFYWPDIEAFFDTKFLKRVSTGEVFTVAARVATGLGPTRNRGEFALALKANEDG